MYLGSWIFFIPRCPSCSSRSASGDDQYSFCSWVARSKMKLNTDSGGLLKDNSSSTQRGAGRLGLPRFREAGIRSAPTRHQHQIHPQFEPTSQHKPRTPNPATDIISPSSLSQLRSPPVPKVTTPNPPPQSVPPRPSLVGRLEGSG
jgi:hypothetical protein